MKNSTKQSLAVVCTALLLGGCANMVKKDLGPSPREYAGFTAEKKIASAEAADKKEANYTEWWEKVGSKLYKAHDMVPFDVDGESKYYMRWQVLPGPFDKVSFYEEFNPPGASGAVHNVIASVMAKNDGDIIYKKDSVTGAMSPNFLYLDVARSEDVKKLIYRGFFQMGAATVNNVGAAKINANSACGDGCGDTLMNFGGNNEANAASASSSAAETAIDIKNAIGAGEAAAAAVRGY
jgi:hypothetical protein